MVCPPVGLACLLSECRLAGQRRGEPGRRRQVRAARRTRAQPGGGSIDWALSRYGYAGTPDFWQTIGDGHYAFYLAHYRFRFGAKGARVRVYLGPSLGRANFRGHLKQYRSGVLARDNLGQWLAASGGTCGLTVRLAGNAELDVGYRYLRIAGSSHDPWQIPTEVTKASLLQIGLAGRF